MRDCKRMSRLLSIALSGMMVLSVTGCGGSGNGGASESGSAVQEQLAEAETASADAGEAEAAPTDAAADGENVVIKMTWWAVRVDTI